ncbi:MAG: hypothetical protein AVDCRST_MAG54-75, partial [uncultured Actinomycetospora sp.]
AVDPSQASGSAPGDGDERKVRAGDLAHPARRSTTSRRSACMAV